MVGCYAGKGGGGGADDVSLISCFGSLSSSAFFSLSSLKKVLRKLKILNTVLFTVAVLFI